MKSIRFNRLAQRELDEAFQHYETDSPGLGERFLDEVQLALSILRRHPEAAPVVEGAIRRFVLPRFPYNVIYRLVGPHRMRILAIAHQKRQPAYWAGRK